MERKKTSRNVHVDRILALPEPILHHILSFLRLEHVLQTSVPSKTWKRVWHTYPTVSFSLYSSSLSRQKTVLKNLEQTLLNFHKDAISLDKLMLSLHLSDDSKFTSNINRFLIYAIASNVKWNYFDYSYCHKRLSLCFDYSYCHMKYCLPRIVYYAKSIVVLELEHCKLDSPASNLTLFSLRELGLFNCTANDEVIRDIILGVLWLSVWKLLIVKD